MEAEQRKTGKNPRQSGPPWSPPHKDSRNPLAPQDEDTVSYQLRKVGMDCPQKLNLELSTTALGLLERDKEYILAVDTTEVEYWGKRDMWVHYSPGRGWVHRFVGLSVVGHKRLCSPLPQTSSLRNLPS
ncbi:MAG: hypothetical protein KIH08_15405 [Candidatus Freyarchaeota archaeon]|nr:hypothetical protein [Candidatus Jordarchaeia archaeon]MBS7270576.1 hypothetical protein [Candidatus Jordarchaeia archaeon]MBS7281335.1 hypothetical protein [Candidatus Jordarchaeia archaeon]